MTAYKLFRLKSNGSITSLFINKSAELPINKWMKASFYPTKGFKERFGWHSLIHKEAPHLSKNKRVWAEVEIKDFSEFERPASQGGKWFLSKYLKINKILI